LLLWYGHDAEVGEVHDLLPFLARRTRDHVAVHRGRAWHAVGILQTREEPEPGAGVGHVVEPALLVRGALLLVEKLARPAAPLGRDLLWLRRAQLTCAALYPQIDVLSAVPCDAEPDETLFRLRSIELLLHLPELLFRLPGARAGVRVARA